MSHTTPLTSTTRIALGLAGVLGFLVLPAAVAGFGNDTGAPDRAEQVERPDNWRRLLNEVEAPARPDRRPRAGTCVLDPQYLPHTADAIEGWYRSCRGGR